MNIKRMILGSVGLFCGLFGFYAIGQDALYVDQTGNVGIGESNPQAKLHVFEQAAAAVDMIRLENPSGPARLVLVNNGITNTGTVNKKWIFNSNGTLRLSAGFDGPEFVLAANGDLVITGSLTTAGGITPDYVFDPEYKLMPLKDLKAYVDENRHLPGVSSAEQIRESGLNMTDMQMQLLKKVEELVLYAYQQQQIIDELRQDVTDLKSAQ